MLASCDLWISLKHQIRHLMTILRHFTQRHKRESFHFKRSLKLLKYITSASVENITAFHFGDDEASSFGRRTYWNHKKKLLLNKQDHFFPVVHRCVFFSPFSSKSSIKFTTVWKKWKCKSHFPRGSFRPGRSLSALSSAVWEDRFAVQNMSCCWRVHTASSRFHFTMLQRVRPSRTQA